MKFLICTDGSEQADRAIKLGVAVAAGSRAEVTLLGISEGATKSQAISDSLQRGQSLLAEKKISAEVITKSGDPVAEIVKRTQETAYDLVIIGAVRKDRPGAFWMSSKSYKIIKEIRPPVLSVAGKTVSLKRILICSGGKSFIDPAVELTGKLVKGCGASVVLLHVMPEPPALYAGLPRMDLTPEKLLKSRSELSLNLKHEKETLQNAGVPAEVRLRRGAVLEEILREIHDGEYDLVVTGSAPSRHFRTYVLGDISREILNRVSRAVLVVRSEGSSRKPHFWKWWV
jgi:nucleotide-binding universal stress UspA family protein